MYLTDFPLGQYATHGYFISGGCAQITTHACLYQKVVVFFDIHHIWVPQVPSYQQSHAKQVLLGGKAPCDLKTAQFSPPKVRPTEGMVKI